MIKQKVKKMSRLKTWASAILVFICMSSVAESKPIPYPNFMASMLRNKGTEEEYKKFNPALVEFFTNSYERCVNSQLNSNIDRIPRIVHQIWLGGPVPERYHNWMTYWASLEGWEYKLWTDEEADALPMYNKDLYNKCINKGEKSDILRLEILNQFGGIYVDVDYECVNIDIFEELHRQYDFYIGFEPLEHGSIKKRNMFKVCNALLGSVPHHPLVNHLIVNLKANFLAYMPFCGAVERSGPSYLTRIICDYLPNCPDRYRNICLPCTFFYPFTDAEVIELDSLDVFAETGGIHYCSGSWRKKITVYEELLNQEGYQQKEEEPAYSKPLDQEFMYSYSSGLKSSYTQQTYVKGKEND